MQIAHIGQYSGQALVFSTTDSLLNIICLRPVRIWDGSQRQCDWTYGHLCSTDVLLSGCIWIQAILCFYFPDHWIAIIDTIILNQHNLLVVTVEKLNPLQRWEGKKRNTQKSHQVAGCEEIITVNLEVTHTETYPPWLWHVNGLVSCNADNDRVVWVRVWLCVCVCVISRFKGHIDSVPLHNIHLSSVFACVCSSNG